MMLLVITYGQAFWWLR